jgi:hypothetical protein
MSVFFVGCRGLLLVAGEKFLPIHFKIVSKYTVSKDTLARYSCILVAKYTLPRDSAVSKYTLARSQDV